MECLHFRRLVLADPRHPGLEAAAHAAACQACGEWLLRTLQAEAALEAALGVPVPEGLHARLIHGLHGARRWLAGLALAASLLAAVGAALLIGGARSDPLALAGIEFVVYEEALTVATASPTDWNALMQVVRQLGIALPEQLGDMRYICVYPVAGYPAHHLLVGTPLGKLTLLLVPGRPVAARAALASHGLEAVVLPAREGFVAIIGASGRSIARAESLLQLAPAA